MPALVSLVGVGPGDPGLLTLRGVRAIARADTVLHDALVHPATLRHAREGAEILYAGKRKGQDSASQDEINHMMLYRARQGRRVARLKGGDPLLFGRGAEEAAFLAAHDVPFEVIPGVTAALGAGAYAGIPLSHRELSSSIALVTSAERPDKALSAHDWSRLAQATQTLVFYMGVSHLADDAATLIALGRDANTPAAVVQWATHPEQRVVTATLATIAERCRDEGVGSPAVVIVGEVVSLRETLRWWDAGPLFARKVLVTRAREQSAAMLDELVEEGAIPVEVPVLCFEEPSDLEPLARAVGELAHGAYAVVAFTSQNGVDRWFRALDVRGLDARAFGRAKVVAIGPATAEALKVRGVRADAVAKEFRGEGVATEIERLLGDRVRGARVLIARAEVARDALPKALAAAGAVPDVVAVYKTVSPPVGEIDALRERLARGEIDAVTFTSSSTVTHLCDALGEGAAELFTRTRVASIGPVTSETARGRGLRVDIEAREYTVPGLLEALREHFTHERSRSKS